MSGRLDWQRAAMRDKVRSFGPQPKPPVSLGPTPNASPSKKKRRRSKHKRGIAPEQAKALAALRRQQARPWDGNGMRYDEAERAIADARRELAQ